MTSIRYTGMNHGYDLSYLSLSDKIPRETGLRKSGIILLILSLRRTDGRDVGARTMHRITSLFRTTNTMTRLVIPQTEKATG